jgi:NADPH-dependent glutamate synthase beta subunit-like oxidoreductase
MQAGLSDRCRNDQVEMIKLKIDNREVTVRQGMTILEAASGEGIYIPAMCHNKESGHFTSCMICLVRERGSTSLFPSCASVVREGMDIITSDDVIEEARKTALDLLLSEHTGDCEAPCRIACPANMDIPQMNRHLAGGNEDQALAVIMRDIALPSVLGRICPAPCEGACHRKGHDSAVSVCALKRYAGDTGDISITSQPERGGSVAIIGAGVAGLSAAFYLRVKGISCTLYDSNPLPGGAIRYETGDSIFDKSVLDREAEFILGSGVSFRPDTTVTAAMFNRLVEENDAVVVATGNFSQQIADWGIHNNGKQAVVDKNSYRTNFPNVFAIGNVNRKTKLAIRSAAQGKEVAFSVEQLLNGDEPQGEPKLFNSRTGRLRKEEYAIYMEGISPSPRTQDPEPAGEGMDKSQAAQEAERCMHCECLKPFNCSLRDLSTKYGASQKRFGFEARRPVKKFTGHDLIVYEPGKCIKCGICVRLAGKYGERPGLTFMGRGYDVEIAVPFEESIKDAVKKAGMIVARACPTGALALKAGINEKTGINEP